jgi:hypothetical protein
MTWLIALVAAAIAGQVGSPAALPAIERHRVGPVVIDGNAQELYAEFPADRRQLVDLAHEGHLSPALMLRFAGSTRRDGVVAELLCGKDLQVHRIQVRDPAFRTSKGIGVGSTVRELRAAYRLDSVVAGEGNVAIRVEELSASFGLDQKSPGGDQLWRIRTPSAVPDTVKIDLVLLTR